MAYSAVASHKILLDQSVSRVRKRLFYRWCFLFVGGKEMPLYLYDNRVSILDRCRGRISPPWTKL